MKTSIALLLGSVLVSTAWAQSVDTPSIHAGDTWIYRNTVERGPSGWNQTRDEITVTRVTGSSIYLTTKPNGSAQPPREIVTAIDWSRARGIDGVETVVNKPLSFPLHTDESWNLGYTDTHPGNKTHQTEKYASVYRVIGYEEVEVPAGKFNALKIEAEGTWTAEVAKTSSVVQAAQAVPGNTSMATSIQTTSPGTVSGKTYKAFWYDPEVKRWVKSVEEFYSTGNVRTERFTSELESFKPAS